MPRPAMIHFLVLSTSLASLAAAARATAADACDALYAAGVKSIQTPHHVFSTTTQSGAPPRAGEAIYAGGVEYLKLNDKWQRSPMTQQEMVEAAQEKLKTHPDTCTLVGDQNMAGQSVTVYKVRNNETGGEQLVRILKSSGLMAGSTLTLPNGTVVETRYEYRNVQAPAGVS